MDKNMIKKEIRRILSPFMVQTKSYKYVVIDTASVYAIQLTNRYKDVLFINMIAKEEKISLILTNENNENILYKLECCTYIKEIKLFTLCLNNILESF
uniref:Uncharacterized protein n=1 Tax=Siphoviridae sp. ctuUw41 TaxID=2826503 RepID=A0A8S5MXX7_9CAUD|nr:MAG TPA: hypothetical protein [Siphoviridae sp. ctuUw41]